MIINEDFFDSEEIDNEVVSKNELASDDSNDYRYCRYLMTARIPEEHLQDFSKERFKNVMDRIVLVDYGVEYFDDRIFLYFNHFFKTLNQYLNFLLTVYNAAVRMIDNWICELNDDEEDGELSLFADLSVIVQRYTNPSELTFMNTIESIRILKEFVSILNDGEDIFDEDDYAYIFNMCLKKNTRVAEKIFIEKYPKFSTQLNLKNKIATVWTSNERIQNMLNNSLHIDPKIVIKEISLIEVSFKDKSDYSFNVVAVDPDKPDFNDALSGFRHYKKLKQRPFFEIYPEQCSFYINHGEGKYAVCYPVGQILEKDKQTKSLYYLRIVYNFDSLYYNYDYMGFAKFLLDKMSIE